MSREDPGRLDPGPCGVRCSPSPEIGDIVWPTLSAAALEQLVEVTPQDPDATAYPDRGKGFSVDPIPDRLLI